MAQVFGSDEKLTAALLDRLAERATVITTKGKSYRMRKGGTSDGPATTSEPEPTTSKTKEAKTRVDSIPTLLNKRVDQFHGAETDHFQSAASSRPL